MIKGVPIPIVIDADGDGSDEKCVVKTSCSSPAKTGTKLKDSAARSKRSFSEDYRSPNDSNSAGRRAGRSCKSNSLTMDSPNANVIPVGDVNNAAANNNSNPAGTNPNVLNAQVRLRQARKDRQKQLKGLHIESLLYLKNYIFTAIF